MTDVLVIGGGIIGCAAALELARRGARVCVVERRVPGAEASGAAAGIVGSQDEARKDDPLFRLTRLGLARYPAFVELLREATGIDVGYRPCGVTRVALTEDDLATFVRETAWQREAGLRADLLDARALHALEPNVAARAAGGIHFADEVRIDPPLLVRATHIAAELRGATFRTGAHAQRVVVRDGRARGVMLESGALLEADAVVIAAGSYSNLIQGTPLPADAIEPVRGQIVELMLQVPLLHGVITGKDAYLSPRDDGRLLIGSTRERVGFKPGVTAGAVRNLLDAALHLVPRLADAALSRTWSGFRPFPRDGNPLLGATSIEGLFLATGHFASGVMLAPITAEILAAAILGEAPPVDVTPFAATRALGGD